ncbi:MAG TPA: DNA internalization-related competence protein ComEC/Rec2 [Woeseiaceae bacterium]|nr:DNA internalization-related competence protein ComEC/Rec2 [Woeseiaceae bacterium]
MQSISIIKSTTIVRASLLILTGGFAAQHSRVLPDSDLCQALFVATVVMFLSRRCRYVALIMLGYLCFIVAGRTVIDHRLDARFEGDSMLAQVRIVDFPRPIGPSVTLLIEPVDDHRLPRRSRVSWYEPSALPKLGETWELELRLRRPRGHSNPGVFRLEDWMFREGIHASGYVVPGKRNRLLQSAAPNASRTFRHGFVEFATTHGGDSAAVIVAVGIGARHLVSQAQWDRYARTGTSHLMAISGLHIGLAATSAFALLTLLFGCLRLRGNHLDRATGLSALIAGAYALVSGLAVPSQRATLMLVLAALAFVLRRRLDSPRVVTLAAILVYLADPLSILRPGFLLSFGAVVILLRYAQSTHDYASDRTPAGRLWTWLRSLTGMQFALLFGLLPLTTLYFSRVAILAPLANLIVVPLFSLVVVPATLLALGCYRWLPFLGRLALEIANASVTVIERLLAFIATVPFSSLSIATSGLHWLVVVLPVLWILLPRSFPGRWLALLAALALLTYRPASPRPGCFDLHVLDVGQGLAVILQTRTHTLLFDTGADYRGGGSASEQVILPFLQHRGIDAIDWLVVSHADNDHAGGVTTLLPLVRPGGIYAGEALPTTDALPCVVGQQWQADGVSFRFIYPAGNRRPEGNDASCVLSVRVGRFRALLTGDIEAAAERDILERAVFSASDVVVIPHHGSLTSSTLPFVTRVRPRLAIASAGFANRWGLPRQEVVDRWQDTGARVVDTATSGAVSVSVCARDGIRHLRRNREAVQRFWHDTASR